MTEKEKMLAGLPYDPADHTLAADRCRAQTLCRRICLDPFGEAAARTALLKELFGSTGTDVYVEPNFRCDYGYNIHVGEGFYANYDCIMLDSAPITIGDGCMFGPRVSLITATHPVEAERRCWRDDIPYEGEYARPITIGHRQSRRHHRRPGGDRLRFRGHPGYPRRQPGRRGPCGREKAAQLGLKKRGGCPLKGVCRAFTHLLSTNRLLSVTKFATLYRTSTWSMSFSAIYWVRGVLLYLGSKRWTSEKSAVRKGARLSL